MRRAAIVRAPANLNLTLEVIGKLTSGYHAIRSIFVKLDAVADALHIKVDPAGKGVHITTQSRSAASASGPVLRAQRLLAVLPEHLGDMAAFSLATGLRAASVTGLQWSPVDLQRAVTWVHPDQAKARRAIAVPLNTEALALVQKQIGKHPTHLFSYRGRPIVQGSTKARYAALQPAGISDFRWHDLRHTWASWHVQNGTPQFALQDMGGWESPQMVRRYAHLAADHLSPYAQRLNPLRAAASENYGTFSSQP